MAVSASLGANIFHILFPGSQIDTSVRNSDNISLECHAACGEQAAQTVNDMNTAI